MDVAFLKRWFQRTVEFDDDASAVVELGPRAARPTPNEIEVDLAQAYENHFEQVFKDSAPMRRRSLQAYLAPRS